MTITSPFTAADGALTWVGDGETVRIEPWGANSIRVRARFMQPIADADWALLPPPADAPAPTIVIADDGSQASLTNGGITVTARMPRWDGRCELTFTDADGTVLFKEADDGGALRLKARKYEPLPGGGSRTTVTFDADPHEHLYGMGEYQQPVMDLKGTTLELAHRNSQVSVPFVVSSKGYGFLWHNPAVGRATFAKTGTQWQAAACDQIDYWVTAGDSPAQIERQYADATGHAPVMPEWGLGFWQCKLRYWNQEQLLETAREFKRRNIPIDLHEMGIKLMVSVWPQIDLESENYDEMRAHNYLAHVTSGKDVGMWWPRDNQFLDATNPEARAFVWGLAKRNYTDLGVDAFWLDEAEPEWGGDYDYDHYLFHIGPVNKVGNVYPQLYNKTFYDGQLEIGRENEIVNLTRAAWAGSQRYGSLVWSGDVHSTFDDLKAQITCQVHMGMAGIPWFTTDMGGPRCPANRRSTARATRSTTSTPARTTSRGATAKTSSGSCASTSRCGRHYARIRAICSRRRTPTASRSPAACSTSSRTTRPQPTWPTSICSARTCSWHPSPSSARARARSICRATNRRRGRTCTMAPSTPAVGPSRSTRRSTCSRCSPATAPITA